MTDLGDRPVPIGSVELEMYLWEIIYAAEQMPRLAERLNNLFEEVYDGAEQHVTEIFATCNAILTAASSVYWAMTAEPNWRIVAEPRRSQLVQFSKNREWTIREVLGDPPEILTNRKVRNGMEHFAARLDQFLIHPPQFMADRTIADSEVFEMPDPDGNPVTPKHLRLYRRDINALFLLGDRILIQEVIDAIVAVGARASAEIEAMKSRPLRVVIDERLFDGLPRTVS